jgi:DNA-binding NarL/FixJ family response regulator
MKFILVDNNKTFRESVKYYLETILDHEVIACADDGLAFLELDNIYLADIILMDIEMPNLNGVDTVKKAQWINNDNIFIAVTAHKENTYLRELLSAGFKACIFKDNFFDEFEKTISSVMNNKLKFPKKISL